MEFEFTPEVKDIASVPEQFRPLYVEKADKTGFAIRSDDAAVKGAVEAILGLNRACKAIREEKRGLEKKIVDLGPLSDFGATPNEIAAAVKAKLDELHSQVKGGKEATVNIEKIRADLAAGHATELAKHTKRSEALQNQLYGHLVDSTAKTAIATAKGDVDLLLPFVKAKVRVVEEDGQFKVLVVDDGGDRRYSTLTGQPMTIAELVSEMKTNAKYGKLFESEIRSGGGAPAGGSSRRVPVADGQKSSMQKISEGMRQRGLIK